MLDIPLIAQIAGIVTGGIAVIYLAYFFHDRRPHVSLRADFGSHKIWVHYEDGGSEKRPVPALQIIAVNKGKLFVHVSSIELFAASRLIPIQPDEFQSPEHTGHFRLEYLSPMEPNRRVSLFYEGKKVYEALSEDLKKKKKIDVKVQIVDELEGRFSSNRVSIRLSEISNIDYETIQPVTNPVP